MCSRIFGPAMIPSFVMCPMMMTDVLVCFAYFISSAAHSRICETLPGDESIESEWIVWIESMMTRSGL